ncbi:MAG: PAS domain S-box protein [Sideroxydans sp.]|jgi:PAS domain S-box-containing protein
MKPIHRSITLLIAATLTMALVAQLTFWTFGQINDDSELRRHTRILLQNSEDLISNLAGAETAQRGFLLTGNATFLQPYLTVQGDTAKLLASLQQMNQSKAARQHLDTAASLIESKLAEMAKVVDFSQKNNFKAALSVMNTGEGKKLMDAIRVEISAFQKVQEELRLQNEARLKANLRQLFFILVAASLFTLFSALIFAFVIYRQAQQNIRNQVHLKTQRALALQEDANIRLQRAYFDLQVSEEKLGVTLNSIGDAVIATDALGRVTFLNPQAGVLTGWTLQEAVGQPIEAIFNIISQQTRLPAAIPVNDALAHGTIQGLTNHVVLITRNGGEHAIADSCAPIRSANSEILGAVLVFRDVSNEYAAQQALVDSNALTQAILNTVADGIVTLHASSGVIETINPAVEVLFGYTADELIGRKFDLLIPGLDQTLRNEIFDPNHIDKNVTTLIQRNEIVGRRNDGSRFPLEMTINQIWLDGERHFAGILHNLTARQAAMESQLESGALQNAIFNSENFSSIATDAKGVIQIFNVGAERMLGYSAAEVMDKITPADFSDPEELVARAKALSAELGTPIAPGFEALVFKASRGIEDIYELTSICKDGSRLPVVLSVTALRDAQNEIIGYLLIGTDNTASKQAEEALLKAGALQKAIFDSANFSSIATDAKGVIQIFNVGAERMLGYAAADVMNKITPADLSDPQEVIARAEALSAELNTKITPGFEALVFKAARGIEDIYELTYIRKGGSRFPAVVSVTALRDAQNDIIGYLLIGTDNTARKQIEAEQKLLDQRLRDQQFYTRSLIESNIDAIMTTDPSGIITDVNKQMEALTGSTRDELIGSPFKNSFTDPERAESGIKKVLSAKKVTDYELTARARDNKQTVVSLNATTFYDRDRRLQGVFAAARDVTERKRLDIELESAKSVAEKANLAKSEFLSSMSHELRSPLNAILGFAQLMESDAAKVTSSQKESITQILQAGWHLLKLINEILDLAKVESGQVPLSQEPVSLAEVMLECQSMIEPQAQQRGIKLTFPRFDIPQFVQADRTRLKQVLINLLSNAIKYNREQGTVEVSCTESTPERIRISVKDSGAGLSPEQLAQLFQAFNRLGQEAGSVEGTGIGLVVAKQLVELMGGTIGMESSIGVGSVFWFELIAVADPLLAMEESPLIAMEESPLLATEESPAATVAQAQAPRVARLHSTLLYVEDKPANMKLVEKLIARHPDMSLLTAMNGNSGIEIARDKQPDVILMDINLPDINGFEALNILRGDPATVHIPVIAVSANAMPLDIERGRKAGFFRYITKPIKVDEFMGVLNTALEFADEKSDK